MAYFHENLKYHEDTKEKRALTKEDIDFLKALQKERNTQDTCATADVRTWVIKDRYDYEGTEEDYDYINLYDTYSCNYLDLVDVYKLLKDNESETDYYDVKLLFDNLKYKNNEISFNYCSEDEVIIKELEKENIKIKTRFCNDEIISNIIDLNNNINVSYRKIGWQNKFAFLTQKAAEEYLKTYGYNHSDDAHTYCICTYRDTEIAKLMDIVESIDWDRVCNFGIDLGVE